MSDTDNFYLGRIYDTKAAKLTETPLMLDPTDLTTHAVITGMTGSGKTGLGIGLLEEAAMHGLPAIIIDPKGDLTNLVLHFPDLAPADFEPWMDAEQARRAKKDVAQLAEETAETWRKGLESWGYGREQLQNLKDSVDYTIYTPGSSAGVPVNILSSFAAPELAWEGNSEVHREKIASTVTALLGLVGMNDIDPLRSREHILISNLIEAAWSQGHSLDLMELILQVQKPPIERLGAFPVESFFPEKDRFALSMLLNNFLASPSFQAWQEGQTLDIGAILWGPGGRPRHSVFYLAHLSENERMFFTTLLFAAIESWMRAQRGTGNLRVLVYFDEIVGYLPPVANPPSRPIMLRMLKQARAFGVGLVLATQNPVDLDYKALANAGTWMIGRLQTERDKLRLLEGLESLQGGIPRADVDKMISGLQKRVFLLHSVHAKEPRLFQTRWVLNYLAGPLTRAQIPALNLLAGAAKKTAAPRKPAAESGDRTDSVRAGGAAAAAASTRVEARQAGAGHSGTRPSVPSGIQEFFLPAGLGVDKALQAAGLPAGAAKGAEGIVYKPALLAQAEVRYLARKYNLEYRQKKASLLEEIGSGLVRWEDVQVTAQDPQALHAGPLPQSRFEVLPGWLTDARRIKALEKDFADWVFRTGSIRIKANEALKVYAPPDASTAEFRERCSEAAKAVLESEKSKLEAGFNKKIVTLETKLKRQQMEVDEYRDRLNQRRLEEVGKGVETLFGMLSSRRKSISSSLTKRRLTSQSKSQLQQEEEDLRAITAELERQQKEYEGSLNALQDQWAERVNDISEVMVTPLKSDIFLELFGVAWLPYYVVKASGAEKVLPAFTT